MTHCARGDEYIVGQEAHTYRYEAGGAAVLGSVQPQPLDNAADGTIPLAGDRGGDQAERFALREDASSRAREHDRRQGAAARATRRRCASRRHARPRDASRRRAPVERRGEAGRAAADDREGLRFRLGVPVEGARSAGRLGAVRRPRLHQRRAALAQDAGRRHAAGGHPRGGGPLRARATTSSGSPTTTRTPRGSSRPREARRARVAPTQTNMVFVVVARDRSRRRSPRTSRPTACGRTGTAKQRWCTHLDVSRADVDAAIASRRPVLRAALTQR